jgi:hypothetical protein
MSLYLVEHIPHGNDETVSRPTDLIGLARHAGDTRHGARWLSTFTPDLHDDRHFSLWEASTAAEIEAVMTAFGFLDDWDIKAFVVRQWGPEDVIAEHDSA